MMRPLIKVTLYDATSENDCILLEEGGEYFVNFGNTTSRTSPVRVRILPRAPISRSRSHRRPAPDF